MYVWLIPLVKYVVANQIRGCIGSITVIAENKTHSNLVRLVGRMLSYRHTSSTCLVLRRGH